MSISRIVAAIALSASVAVAQGRDPRAAQPERPTVATHAGTVAPGFLEAEWGAEVSPGPDIAIPVYLKLGLRRNTQFGLLLPISWPSAGDPGFGDMQFALKWRVMDDNPVLGDFAMQPSVILPTGSGSNSTGVGFLLISSRSLGKVALDLNAGVTAASGYNAALWTISLGGPASGKWGWTGELSGTTTAGSSRMQLLAGPTYRLRRSVVFDFGVIAPLDAGPSGDLHFYVGAVTNLGRLIGK